MILTAPQLAEYIRVMRDGGVRAVKMGDVEIVLRDEPAFDASQVTSPDPGTPEYTVWLNRAQGLPDDWKAPERAKQ